MALGLSKRMKAGDWDRDDSREALKNVTGDLEAARKYVSKNPNFLEEWWHTRTHIIHRPYQP